jgi:CTP:molybdopterin cytidylyltransferase MocA
MAADGGNTFVFRLTQEGRTVCRRRVSRGRSSVDEHGPRSIRQPRIFAIVPAAGRSKRMGCAKQLLDFAGRPMLAAVVDSLTAAGVTHVTVVTRSAVAAESADALPNGVFIVCNDDPATEMIDSIRIGLNAWTGRERIDANDGILVLPGDQPGIAPACIHACVEAFVQDPACIVVATYKGRRGHPLVFPGALIEFALSPECDGGLRELPRAHADRVRTVECECDAVVRDIDTPADCREIP